MLKSQFHQHPAAAPAELMQAGGAGISSTRDTMALPWAESKAMAVTLQLPAQIQGAAGHPVLK